MVVGYSADLEVHAPWAVRFGAIRGLWARGDSPTAFEWRPKLPRSEWPRVEAAWMRNIVRPRALKKIRADHSLYARDYDRFT